MDGKCDEMLKSLDIPESPSIDQTTRVSKVEGKEDSHVLAGGSEKMKLHIEVEKSLEQAGLEILIRQLLVALQLHRDN